MENDYITAEWARKTSQTQLGAVVKQQLNTALEKIKAAVIKNELSTNLYFNLEDLTRKELVKRGFSVEFIAPDPREHYDTGYYRINW